MYIFHQKIPHFIFRPIPYIWKLVLEYRCGDFLCIPVNTDAAANPFPHSPVRADGHLSDSAFFFPGIPWSPDLLPAAALLCYPAGLQIKFMVTVETSFRPERERRRPASIIIPRRLRNPCSPYWFVARRSTYLHSRHKTHVMKIY